MRRKWCLVLLELFFNKSFYMLTTACNIPLLAIIYYLIGYDTYDSTIWNFFRESILTSFVDMYPMILI